MKQESPISINEVTPTHNVPENDFVFHVTSPNPVYFQISYVKPITIKGEGTYKTLSTTPDLKKETAIPTKTLTTNTYSGMFALTPHEKAEAVEIRVIDFLGNVATKIIPLDQMQSELHENTPQANAIVPLEANPETSTTIRKTTYQTKKGEVIITSNHGYIVVDFPFEVEDNEEHNVHIFHKGSTAKIASLAQRKRDNKYVIFNPKLIGGKNKLSFKPKDYVALTLDIEL